MPEGEAIGSAFVEISARNEKLKADLEESRELVRTEMTKAESAADMGDTVRSSIGGIKLLREEQTRTADSMTEMGSIGRRELIMLSSQFGTTGVAAQRMFMLIQAHSPAASAAIGKIGSALMVAGVAAMAEQAILSGIQKHFDRQLEAAKTANDLAQKQLDNYMQLRMAAYEIAKIREADVSTLENVKNIEGEILAIEEQLPYWLTEQDKRREAIAKITKAETAELNKQKKLEEELVEIAQTRNKLGLDITADFIKRTRGEEAAAIYAADVEEDKRVKEMGAIGEAELEIRKYYDSKRADIHKEYVEKAQKTEETAAREADDEAAKLYDLRLERRHKGQDDELRAVIRGEEDKLRARIDGLEDEKKAHGAVLDEMLSKRRENLDRMRAEQGEWMAPQDVWKRTMTGEFEIKFAEKELQREERELRKEGNRIEKELTAAIEDLRDQIREMNQGGGE
jgi:hypothetical protein